MLARASTNATIEDIAPAEHVNVVDVVDTVESPDTVTDSGVVTDAGETRHSPVIVRQVPYYSLSFWSLYHDFVCIVMIGYVFVTMITRYRYLKCKNSKHTMI